MRTYGRPIKKNTDVYSRAHSCGVRTVCGPGVGVEVGLSFGILGCGVLNCLEETWEERGYREKRKEGGRAQCAAGISERNSFTLASPTALFD